MGDRYNRIGVMVLFIAFFVMLGIVFVMPAQDVDSFQAKMRSSSK